MADRQRRRMPNGSAAENNGLHNRGESQRSLQMAAIRRQYAEREQLEVDLARRRSADIIASARQSARESAERIRHQVQGIRNRWDSTSQLSAASHPYTLHSHPYTLQNPVSGYSSEPRVGQSRTSEHYPTLGRTDPPGHPWGNHTTHFASNNAQTPDRRTLNESRLVNSSTYFRIQIDHACASSNFRSMADQTMPPACTSWSNAGRVGIRAGHFQQSRQETTAMQEAADGHPGISAGQHLGPGAARHTRPTLRGYAGQNTLRETASFVNSPAYPSDRNHGNLGWRRSYVGLSEDASFYEAPAFVTGNEYGLAKETHHVELTASDAFPGYGLVSEDNRLPELSRLHTCRDYRISENVDHSELPVILVRDVHDAPSDESPALYLVQGIHASGTDNVLDWNLTVGDENEEEKIADKSGEETSGILASLSDLEQFIQNMERDIDSQSNRLSTEGNDSPVLHEDLSALWQVIAKCEGVAQAVEDSGGFDADETLYEWSLDRLDKLATACYRFVVCLIGDLVKISDRSNWKPEEFRIYLDAALLVKRTCEKMMETTADEQVSLRRPPSGTLLHILLIYIRTLRLVLELYALLNNSKPAELSQWSASLYEALKAFATEANRDLLDFHELLSHRLSEKEFHVDGNGRDDETERNPQEDNDLRWNWRENEISSGDYDARLLTQQLTQGHTSEGDDKGGIGGGEAGVDGIQNPTSLSQYLQATSFSHNIEDPYLQGLVIPSGPEFRYASLYNESNHEADGRTDGGPSRRTEPEFMESATIAANESDLSTDRETDRPMEGSYPPDPYRQDTTNNELTSEELDIFQSMLSPSTFQLLRESVLPTIAQEENIMLALSVQMASQVFTERSSGVFGGVVYDDEPNQAETFDVLVSRSSTTLLDDLVQLYINAPTNLLHSRLNVVFEGEPGVDGGALSREFFCLIFQALIDRTVKNRSLFEGDPGHLLPAIDHVLSEAKVFWIVGILVAQAACNGCHGLPGLSPAVRRFLASGARVSSLEEISQLTTLEDVADLDLRNLLKKVRERTALNEEEKSSLETWLNRSRFSFVMSEEKTDEAIRRILRYYIFESRMSQLVSIAEGMEELGWRPVPSGFDVDTVFPSGEEISLDDFFRCLVINETSAWRSHDLHRAFQFFRNLCTELHQGKMDRLQLSSLLHFFTGAPYLKSGANVTFASPDDGVIYPQARTCNLELIIPTLHKTYDDFKAAFSKALLLGSYGFGFA